MVSVVFKVNIQVKILYIIFNSPLLLFYRWGLTMLSCQLLLHVRVAIKLNCDQWALVGGHGGRREPHLALLFSFFLLEMQQPIWNWEDESQYHWGQQKRNNEFTSLTFYIFNDILEKLLWKIYIKLMFFHVHWVFVRDAYNPNWSTLIIIVIMHRRVILRKFRLYI